MPNLPGCTSLSSIPTLASAGVGIGTLWLVGLPPFPVIVLVVLPPMDSLCAPQESVWPTCDVGTALWGLSRPAGACNGELPGVDVCEWDAWVWHPPVLGDRRAWCLVLQIISYIINGIANCPLWEIRRFIKNTLKFFFLWYLIQWNEQIEM